MKGACSRLTLLTLRMKASKVRDERGEGKAVQEGGRLQVAGW